MDDLTPTISVKDIKSLGKCIYIDDDFLLFDDITQVPCANRPRRVGYMMLALCQQGQVEYCLDTVNQTMAAGDFIIVNPGQVTANVNMSKDCIGKVLFLSEDFIREIEAGLRILSSLFIFTRTHPVYRLSKGQQDITLDYVRMIHREVRNVDNHFRRDTVRSLIHALIYDAGNIIWCNQENEQEKSSVRAEKIFMDFIHLVEQNFKNERRVAWYGKQLDITPKYLSEAIKQVSGRTPSEWIDDFVIQELRFILKTTTMSIKEITEHMKFPNQSFLGKYFKEHVGMSPSEFRKQ